MKRLYTILIFILFSFILIRAQEEEEEREEREETTYSAKKIEYLIEKDLIILSDSAVSEHKDILVMADTIEYNVKAKIVKAYGHPFLIDDKDTITGTYMVYNIETRKGMMTQGAGRIEKGFFSGDTIFKVGEKTLNVKKGDFTTCSKAPPDYSFYSTRMKVYSNDMVICEPVVLKIQDIPVFVIPFWFFPITKGRHSGFLVPKIGKGSAEGRYVRNLTYFWATNNYSDITITFDIFEKRGVKTYLNGRYVVGPFLLGSVSGSYINDILEKSRRWEFKLEHKHILAKRLSLTARANFLSDVDYNVDYSEEEVVRLDKEIESYVSVSKSWSGANLNFLVNEKRDLDKNTIDRRIPRMGFSLSSRRIIPVRKDVTPKWYNQAYFSYSANFINKTHEDDDTTTNNYGLANHIKLQAPQNILSYLNISPAITVWGNIYDKDIYGNPYPVRSYYSTSISARTIIYGFSKGGIGRFIKFRHIVKPSLSYNYSPEEEEAEKYCSLEGMGVGSAQKNISFSLSNSVQTKMNSNGKEKKIDLINMITSVSYNFRKDEEPLSNIRNTFEINPIKEFSTRVETEHNPYERELKKFTVRTTFRFKGNLTKESETSFMGEGMRIKVWKINVTHNYVKGIGENTDSQQLFGGVETWVTKNWKIGFNARYDFTDNKLINQTLSIYRDLHCWEAQFSWNSYGGEWKYDFKVSIKKVPEIKVTKGVFGIFIP